MKSSNTFRVGLFFLSLVFFMAQSSLEKKIQWRITAGNVQFLEATQGIVWLSYMWFPYSLVWLSLFYCRQVLVAPPVNLGTSTIVSAIAIAVIKATITTSSESPTATMPTASTTTAAPKAAA